MNDVVINMTPHDVKILDKDNRVVKTYKKSGNLIHFTSKIVIDDVLSDGTPLSHTEYSGLENLLEYNHKVFYIVPQLIKFLLPYRTDILVPADVVKDETGIIVGYRSLDW